MSVGNSAKICKFGTAISDIHSLLCKWIIKVLYIYIQYLGVISIIDHASYRR